MSDEIRIVLAEDSLTVRRYLVSLIEETPGMRVIGEARNGVEAVRMVTELKPDVVSMDINMPDLDGLEATRQIMTQCPTPVVVVSGLLDGDVQLSLQALESGALAVVSKPPDRHNPAFDDRRRQLITTLRAMSGVKVIARKAYARAGEVVQEAVEVPAVVSPIPSRVRVARPEIIAIGASTGGPSAMNRLLRDFPPTLPVPIVIVQHMPNEFIPGLARWLASATMLNVQVARDGMLLRPATVVIAPGTAHMLLDRRGSHLAIRLSEEKYNTRYQPSVDVLFESIAQVCGRSAIGIIMTGMGDDGALGLQAMYQAGAFTLAQDESSSTVFGMPRAAIERGVVHYVMPLTNLPSQILKLL
jgi:two-component system chemotaxis response regulator CheB